MSLSSLGAGFHQDQPALLHHHHDVDVSEGIKSWSAPNLIFASSQQDCFQSCTEPSHFQQSSTHVLGLGHRQYTLRNQNSKSVHLGRRTGAIELIIRSFYGFKTAS